MGVTLTLKHKMSEFLFFSKTVVYSAYPYLTADSLPASDCHQVPVYVLHILIFSTALWTKSFSAARILLLLPLLLHRDLENHKFNPAPPPPHLHPSTQNHLVVPYFLQDSIHTSPGWHSKTFRIWPLWLSFRHHPSPAPGHS